MVSTKHSRKWTVYLLQPSKNAEEKVVPRQSPTIAFKISLFCSLFCFGYCLAIWLYYFISFIATIYWLLLYFYICIPIILRLDRGVIFCPVFSDVSWPWQHGGNFESFVCLTSESVSSPRRLIPKSCSGCYLSYGSLMGMYLFGYLARAMLKMAFPLSKQDCMISWMPLTKCILHIVFIKGKYLWFGGQEVIYLWIIPPC